MTDAATTGTFETDFSVQLVTQINKGGKTKATKEVKTKLLLFQVKSSDENHIEFLQAAIDHHNESYKITRNTLFGFKYLIGSKP